jgi:hypothetical protein
MNSWQSIKDKETFAKGRHAVRNDYVKGTYDRCAFVSFSPSKAMAGRAYAAAKRREERAPTQAALNEVFVAIRNLDKKRKSNA